MSVLKTPTANNTSTWTAPTSVHYNSTTITPSNSSVLHNGSSPANASVSLCWNQWESYWSAELYASTWYPDGDFIPTKTETNYETYSSQPGTTYTSDTSWVVTTTIYQGAYAISTETTLYTYATTVRDSDQPVSTATYTDTDFEWVTTGSAPNASTITQPPCVLPSSVPQCQSSWMTYLSHYVNDSYTTPKCQAANVDDSLCWSFRDAYVNLNTDYDSKQFEEVSRGYTFSTWSSDQAVWEWPTWKTLAPSCTLGCARCAMTGGTIQLLYWPPGTTYRTAAGPVIAETDGTTLTYPTVYVSYKEVYASDKCKGVGPTITDTIVAIPNSADISSIYASITFADLEAMFNSLGLFTASFDMADLQTPVAPDVYSRQPWCISQLAQSAAYYTDGTYYENLGTTGPPSNYSCPTTNPYKPLLWLPSSILQSMDSRWATCSGDINGVYDPPKALTPVATEAQVTVPGAASTTAASPLSSVQAPTPAATGGTTAAPASQAAASGPTETAQASQVSAADPSDPTNAADPANIGSQQQTNADPADPTPVSGNDSPAVTAPQSANDDPAVLNSAIGEVATNAASSGESQGDTANAVSVAASGATGDPSAADDTPSGTTGGSNSGSDSSEGDSGVSNSGSGSNAANSESSSSESGSNAGGSNAGDSGSSTSGSNSGFNSNTGDSGEGSSGEDSGGSASGSGSDTGTSGTSDSGSGSNAGDPGASDSGSSPSVVSVGSSAYTAIGSQPGGSGAVIVAQGGSTATLAADGVTILAGQAVSALSTVGVVVGSGSGAATVATVVDSSASSDPAQDPNLTGAGGQVVHAVTSGGNVVLQQGTSSAVLTPGQVTTFAGQVVSVPTSGSAVVVGGSRTVGLADAASSGDPAAVVTASNGQALSMIHTNGAVQVVDGSSTVSLAPGQETVIAGQTISAPAGGSQVVVDGSRTVPLVGASMTQPPAVITASNGQSLSLVETDGFVQVLVGSSTAVIAPGQQTVIDGETISAASTGGEVIIDGSKTVQLAGQTSATDAAAVFTASNGDAMSFVETNGQVEVIEASTTLMLAPGQETVIAGQAISAASSGADVVVGTRTISLDPTTTSANGAEVTAAQSSSSGHGGHTSGASSSALQAMLNDSPLMIVITGALALLAFV